MIRTVLSVYDYFRKHHAQMWALFAALTALSVLSLSGLHYKEDISDFLPLDEKNQTALKVYQEISGANNIYAIIGTRDTAETDPQELAEGVELFAGRLLDKDSLHFVSGIRKEINMDEMMDVAEAVYAEIPLFLTDDDYRRMDSLLASPDYIDRQIKEDKQMLLFPSSSVIAEQLQRDPLQLFAPVMQRLSGGGAAINFDTYDGYILSPDNRKAFVIIESSFGASESENNARLVELLEEVKTQTENENGDLDIHIIGGPAIAVTNAGQIKTDSMTAVCIAGILILLLLIYVFRNARNILLIFVSVGWGWLLAMAAIAMLYDSVSLIVIGIASVILGIAVNYPLHLIDHLKDSRSPRSALKEIVSPLVVGNITTVGAFLCLVPLDSIALRDLGLFSSLLLVGTILFVLFFLPHLVSIRKGGEAHEPRLITALGRLQIENNRWIVGCCLLLTAVFGYFSTKTEFDSDMRNINFMTESQRADMEYFRSMVTTGSGTEPVYVVSSGETWEEALRQNETVDAAVSRFVANGQAGRHNSASSFLVSEESRKKRLDRWNDFVARHKADLTEKLNEAAKENGFSEGAFSRFSEIVTDSYEPGDLSGLKKLTETVFTGNAYENPADGTKHIIQVLDVAADETDSVITELNGTEGFSGLCFDVRKMNGSIANTLSDDFNYIGIACGFIVFVFLWISLGSLELAIISFIPMAVSWIWILGIMAILGIKFNIVNIILATFIFGQGDDYTIFITEGLSYEYAYRRKLLDSYKNSIVVSALIMFIGIGTLIFAKHPALRSLGEVTVVGMISVVLMAYLFPPLIFKWLTTKNGKVRYRPVTIKKIVCTGYCAAVFLTQLFTAYILGFFLLRLTRPSDRKKLLLHRYCCSVFRFDVTRMPGMKFCFRNPHNEDFSRPAVIISNHQSMLDSFYLMFLNPKMIMIANDHVSTNPVTGRIFRWLGFITVGQGAEGMMEKIRPLVAEGYSVSIFPEGERPSRASDRVKRFHKGAFRFAEELGIDILPVYLHGIVQAMPKGSFLSNGGKVIMEVGQRISNSSLRDLGETTREQARAVRALFQKEFTRICREEATAANISPIVYDRYRYKGASIEGRARKVLRCLRRDHALTEGRHDGRDFLVIDECGQGETSLMLSLMYPDSVIYTCLSDDDALTVLRGCMCEFAGNIRITDDPASVTAEMNDLHVFVVSDNAGNPERYPENHIRIIIK